jgi:hypothetical protein
MGLNNTPSFLFFSGAAAVRFERTKRALRRAAEKQKRFDW